MYSATIGRHLGCVDAQHMFDIPLDALVVIHGGEGPSDRDITLAQADIALNYEDAASPPRLYQRDLDNCGVVSTVNATARTEEGQSFLRDLAAGEPEAPADRGADGDAGLRAVEASTGHREWVRPHEAMEDLGLSAENLQASDAAREFDPARPSVFSSRPAPEGSDAERAMREFGVMPRHAYDMVGTYRNPDTGEDMALLRNPLATSLERDTPIGEETPLNPRTIDANGQTYPGIPIRRIDDVFRTGTIGTLPAR